MAGKDNPSIKARFGWLAGLGVFFYASYGFANWLASTRDNVPSIVFGWERHVLFMDWTIFPYWTTNLFYAASFFLCRTAAELGSHGRRLLTAQVVSVACFMLFPLKFSLPKPDTSGAFGFMFDALGAFDKPFNQAPSLHIALTIILAALYIKILPRGARALFLLWSALVVASVMTTYQHHFIDIPTGALLGLACIWLWPDDGAKRVPVMVTSSKKLGGYYAAGAALLAIAAVYGGGGFLWLLWPAVALLFMALGYLAFGTAIFAKSVQGDIGLPSRLILLPYLWGARLNAMYWTRGETPAVEVADGVYVGSFPSQLPTGVAQVVDLTCEFSRGHDISWQSFPLLDFTATPETLAAAADAVEVARKKGPVLVCCALGYGRSVATVATWLIRTKRAKNVTDAMALLRAKRPRLRIKPYQELAIAKAADA